MGWTKEQLYRYLAKKDLPNRGAQAAEPEPPVCHESLAANDGEAPDSSLISLRITSYRRKLLDRSNLYGGCKYVEDCCVYAGLLPGDSEREINLQVRQVKVDSREEEKTVIEITYP